MSPCPVIIPGSLVVFSKLLGSTSMLCPDYLLFILPLDHEIGYVASAYFQVFDWDQTFQLTFDRKPRTIEEVLVTQACNRARHSVGMHSKRRERIAHRDFHERCSPLTRQLTSELQAPGPFREPRLRARARLQQNRDERFRVCGARRVQAPGCRTVRAPALSRRRSRFPSATPKGWSCRFLPILTDSYRFF